MFKRICFRDWRQFANIDIEFHDHLTVLTGANGAGKTTILNLLSKSIGWEPKFVSSYGMDEKGKGRYYTSLRKLKDILQDALMGESCRNSVTNKLGELEYSDGTIAEFILPDSVNAGTYGVFINSGKSEKGVYINSHRPTFPYKSLRSIPTTFSTREQIYSKYYSFNQTFIYDTFRDPEKISSTSIIKETLASLSIFGYGNKSVVKNEKARELLEGYIEILKIVLPPQLGFEGIAVSVPEVLLRTKTGEFPIDAVFGGVSSIIDITWQLYMFANRTESFIALIDEPENHLHPELQKNFLGNLINAFPNVQFVIVTHNPFMITSQKDSNVYVLNYDESHRVYSQKLDYINRAGTSNAILRDVLGIDSTMPTWAAEELSEVIEKYAGMDFSKTNIELLRKELTALGLADYIPETIARVSEGAE